MGLKTAIGRLVYIKLVKLLYDVLKVLLLSI